MWCRTYFSLCRQIPVSVFYASKMFIHKIRENVSSATLIGNLPFSRPFLWTHTFVKRGWINDCSSWVRCRKWRFTSRCWIWYGSPTHIFTTAEDRMFTPLQLLINCWGLNRMEPSYTPWGEQRQTVTMIISYSLINLLQWRVFIKKIDECVCLWLENSIFLLCSIFYPVLKFLKYF